MKTVMIGKQEWMSENLNVDYYQNGDNIPEVEDPTEWMSLRTGAWCCYDNDPDNGKKYGKLYNWYAVNDPRGLAPQGWHIPTKEEFDILKANVNNDGNALKEVGQGADIGAGTNESGFSALLAGLRSYDNVFYYLNYYAYFWSSTEGTTLNVDRLTLGYNDSSIIFHSSNKECGFSVRCIKDN
jgi:uncharacterized protein (TIGR02145 family)